MYTLSLPRYRNPLLRYWVGILCIWILSTGGISGLSAQNCTAFEKELEEYFLAHQPEDRLNMTRIEQVYRSCSSPTDKMELIFYYFQAINTINSYSSYDYRTYEATTFFYDQSAQFFPYLIQAGPEEDTFVETYFAKAFELEQWLQREARRLRYSPENRYYGESEGEFWAKTSSEHARESGESRGMDDRGLEFKRKFLQRGRYVDELPSYEESIDGSEQFGYVGSIDELSLIEYLDWQRTDPTTDEGDVNPAWLTTDPAAWINTLKATPGAYLPLMSISDNLEIKQEPSDRSASLSTARFGEVLAQITKQMPVVNGEYTFRPVINELGQIGWVNQLDIVEQGRLAVCITNTPGYLKINARTDRNAVLFFAGEMIVLEGARDSWIRVVGRNAQKRGWISGPEILSIDPTDLYIGELMYKALQYTSPETRRSKLEDIREVRGFIQSSLSPYVERLISQYGS